MFLVIYIPGREAVCGKNEYLYTSVLTYGTKRFLSCDDLVVVVGADGGKSSCSRNMNLALHNLEKQA